MRKALFFILAAAVAAAGVWGWMAWKGRSSSPTWQLARIEQGALISQVSSTGTVEAVITVEVGSQVSGQIKELLADFNSEVSAGQIIARIDPVNFEARVRQAEADLAVAQANVAIQRSAVVKAQVALAEARRGLDRNRALYARSSVSKSQIDESESLFDQAAAQVKMSDDQVRQAQAQVQLREASLLASRTDLDHTIIRSPVDGVVISRRVDRGQTVAANLQAPTFFTIAQDLKEMQVIVNLDEADIGRIQTGQRAKFTVDAFPGEDFSGLVIQVRKAAQTMQNVVTYPVVVSAPNPDLRLLPGMTATVNIVVDERQDVLKAPNAALRFRPSRETGVSGSGGAGSPGTGGATQSGSSRASRAAEEAETRLRGLTKALDLSEEQQTRIRDMYAQGRERIRAMYMQGASKEDIQEEVKKMRDRGRESLLPVLTPEQREKFARLLSARAASPSQPGRLWVPGPDNRPVAIEVMTGAGDGSFTQIVRGEVRAGQEVIVGESHPAAARSAGRPPGRLGF
ncbi:MAG: efflux RND transporter periplasmic adaptor subunit [Proteobacteria bacterium]|nr:efflux RND transporter periplasmic adaptor subunit [Pseudomonadota bacterium]